MADFGVRYTAATQKLRENPKTVGAVLLILGIFLIVNNAIVLGYADKQLEKSCPRSSLLATGGVFITLGILAFIAGVVMLAWPKGKM